MDPKFKILISMVNFKHNLPSSSFGHCLFTPNDCLQRKICVFSIIFFPVGEIISVIDTPYP